MPADAQGYVVWALVPDEALQRADRSVAFPAGSKLFGLRGVHSASKGLTRVPLPTPPPSSSGFRLGARFVWLTPEPCGYLDEGGLLASDGLVLHPGP